MNVSPPPSQNRFFSALRKPMVWIALVLLAIVVAATTAVAMELYANTSVPLLVNPR